MEPGVVAGTAVIQAIRPALIPELFGYQRELAMSGASTNAWV